MKQTPTVQQQNRQLRVALLLLLATFLMWRTKPQQPPQPATPPAPAASAAAPSDPQRLAGLLAAGAPPYVADLVLDDPAWAALPPAEQIEAIRKRLGNSKGNNNDPMTARLHLTIAWLYDTALRQRVNAADEYASLSRLVQPDTRGPHPKESAYRFAGQAQMRAAELYQAEAAARTEPSFTKKARHSLDMLSSVIVRFPEAVTLWRQENKRWVKVDDEYGHVLERIDTMTRETPMYRILDKLVTVTGGRQGWNLVFALVFLAVALKGGMYPLSRKSYRSMAEMQKIQPLIQELQKKHKDNPAKLNQEMMQIYSDHGINPLGGCLPMLLQIPVFIFVYQGIRAYTWHFHQVRFLWIESLAAPDLILLLVYGVSMFVTQWMTMRRQPKPQDPSQAQMQQMMGWMMPIMFTYMMYMWKLPSAFYLYWLTFNIISAIEQTITHRHVHGEAAPAVPMAVLREPAGKVPTASRPGRAARHKAGKRRGG